MGNDSPNDEVENVEVQVVVLRNTPQDEAAFETACLNLLAQARRELNYHATRIHAMILEHGAVHATRRLLDEPKIHDGFVNMMLRNRPDLTLEALVLHDEWVDLFTEGQRLTARERLLG